MSFLTRLVDRIPEGINRAQATVEGLINPNHRHDDPEEKNNDRVLMEIRARHRFQSFAAERVDNSVKWHVDGHDYMYAVSEIIDAARECIFILDWWLSPELYLRRPPAANPQWRLDLLLQRKAEQGVKVYIIVYKEVTQTMSMNSAHTKHYLEELHPNIAVMRHPDHIGAKDDVEFWSHHEKVVVVDNHRACIGGLDLCFGRWDTHSHPLADAHPTDFSKTLFPGQEYNNARILDFKAVDQYYDQTISIRESARMPWHDVHMTLVGPCVLDIVQHFTERWNEVKHRKYRDDSRYDWLALPHNVEAAPNEAVARHPHMAKWAQMGRRYKERFTHHIHQNYDQYPEDQDVYHPAPHGSCRVQVVRSVSDWSHGVLTEHSIQNAYIELIQQAQHYIYIENQFFVSNTGDYGPVKNRIAQALLERCLVAARSGARFKVVIVIPEVPGFAGDIHKDTALKTIMAAQYRAMNRGGHSIYEGLRQAGFDPEEYIRFYHLRTYDRINAPPSLIDEMERNSGVSFSQAQIALARQWMGNPPNGTDHLRVIIPAPSSEGIVQSEKTGDRKEAVAVPRSADEARQLIERFEQGACQIRSDDAVADTVGQHNLRDRTRLWDEQWLGTAFEERDAYVSELVYIHTKLMIVDDRRVIMGSANINDRSQKGDGDSEIALVVEDQEPIQSYMNGQPYTAAKFAATLRRSLYKEHLGLIPPQPCQRGDPVTAAMRPAPIPQEDSRNDRQADAMVQDPLCDDTVGLWQTTAKSNRDIYTEVFRPVPSNLVRDWDAYERYVPKVKPGHVVPEIPLERIKQRLTEVRGHVVECPLDFLIDVKELVSNVDWDGLNPTLPIYI